MPSLWSRAAISRVPIGLEGGYSPSSKVGERRLDRCLLNEFADHLGGLLRYLERWELAHPLQTVYRVPRMLPSEGLLCRELLGRTRLAVHVEHGHLWAEVAQHPQRLALERIHSKNLSSRP